MVFGTLHVVKLGANRMQDMRDKATYDLAEMKDHLRAAGEDIVRHRQHEERKQAEKTYALNELEALLEPEQWQLLSEMVTIPAGPFAMGTDAKRADEFNKPKHQVTTPAYRIDKFPVTNVEYAKFILATKHRPPLDWDNGAIPDGKLLHPVTMVSWYDAQAYCRWEGKRLPTEIEWEKAARGTDGRRWPWGDSMNPDNLNTYYYVGSTTKVMRYAQGVSPYGVYDMAGNVSEWTASDFKPYEGSAAPKDVFQPKVAQAVTAKDQAMNVADLVEVKGVYKVRRGGSWKSDPFSTSSYHRNFSMPHYASDFFGFRCSQEGSTN
jgi:iron(II)-dependent oxidoreductase